MPLRPSYPVRTDRLHLRPLTEEDVTDLVAYHADPAVNQFLPIEPFDADTVRARVRSGVWSRTTLEAEGEVLALGVELVATGVVIGDMMLRWLSERDRSGELGYVFHPDHGGQGYATEAAAAILAVAFEDLELHRMVARIDPRNEASLRLARRLGMRQEAHLIHSGWIKGEWTDEIDFALLQEEWLAGRPAN